LNISDKDLKFAELIFKKGNELWIIEVKGKTKNIPVDINTGFGQLIRLMKE